MAAQRHNFEAFRKDPFLCLIRVRGYNLNNVPINFALNLYPDAPPPARIDVGTVIEKGVQGIRVAAVGFTNGLPWSDIEILLRKDTIASLPPAAEAGSDVEFAYDIQWILPSPVGDYVRVEETILFGKFVIKGSVNA